MTNEKKNELIFKLRSAREKHMAAAMSGETFSEVFNSKNEWERLKQDAIGPCISTALMSLSRKYNTDRVINHLRKTTDVFDPIVVEVAKEAFGDDPYAFGINAVVIGEKATTILMSKMVIDHYTEAATRVYN